MSNYTNSQVKYYERLYNETPNTYTKQCLEIFKSLQQYDSQFTSSPSSSDNEEQTTTTTTSTALEDTNPILYYLTLYTNTLPYNEYFTPLDILKGYNNYIKSISDDEPTISALSLDINHVLRLGILLSKIDSLTSQRKRINGTRSTYYIKL